MSPARGEAGVMAGPVRAPGTVMQSLALLLRVRLPLKRGWILPAVWDISGWCAATWWQQGPQGALSVANESAKAS